MEGFTESGVWGGRGGQALAVAGWAAKQNNPGSGPLGGRCPGNSENHARICYEFKLFIADLAASQTPSSSSFASISRAE